MLISAPYSVENTQKKIIYRDIYRYRTCFKLYCDMDFRPYHPTLILLLIWHFESEPSPNNWAIVFCFYQWAPLPLIPCPSFPACRWSDGGGGVVFNEMERRGRVTSRRDKERQTSSSTRIIITQHRIYPYKGYCHIFFIKIYGYFLKNWIFVLVPLCSGDSSMQ